MAKGVVCARVGSLTLFRRFDSQVFVLIQGFNSVSIYMTGYTSDGNDYHTSSLLLLFVSSPCLLSNSVEALLLAIVEILREHNDEGFLTPFPCSFRELSLYTILFWLLCLVFREPASSIGCLDQGLWEEVRNNAVPQISNC